MIHPASLYLLIYTYITVILQQSQTHFYTPYWLGFGGLARTCTHVTKLLHLFNEEPEVDLWLMIEIIEGKGKGKGKGKEEREAFKNGGCK